MTGGTARPLNIGRLTVRPEFLACARGRRAAREGVVIQIAPSERAGAGVRVGFTATKKIGGSVVRNRAKRRLRAAARALLGDLGVAGHDYVFIARAQTPAQPWPSLLDDVRSALLSLAAVVEKDGAAAVGRTKS